MGKFNDGNSEAGMDNAAMDTQQKQVNGPPRLREFAHVSVPCRDLEEGKRFYSKVLGAQMHIEEKSFASFKLAGMARRWISNRCAIRAGNCPTESLHGLLSKPESR